MLINGKNFALPTTGQLNLAKRAYARYGGVTDYKNYQGNPMPKWEELTAQIQLAWVAAADPSYKGSNL